MPTTGMIDLDDRIVLKSKTLKQLIDKAVLPSFRASSAGFRW
jgi:hypothetical protein